jgi:hypothetical protein|tara:strand:+ start:241 stop:684 length:444 start_codon:yes stop_codon:yes gene_type:complete
MKLKQSGSDEKFETGAVRDMADNKPRPDLISPFAEERLGEWLRLGAIRYAERNWEKGMPMSRTLASLNRHLMWFKQGKRDEDHLSAIMFNAMAIIHYEEMIKRGVLPEDLDDLETYLKGQNDKKKSAAKKVVPPKKKKSNKKKGQNA